jgi:surface carbohydrate biosynthesis protein
MPELTPTVYLPIETLSRELDARLLLTSRLLQHNVPVVIGQQWLLNQNLAEGYPPGNVLLKGLNRIQAGIARDLARRGNMCFACDEEALSLSSKTFMGRDIFPTVAGDCALIFAQGDFHREALIERTGCSEDKVTAVGNARLDLLGPTFRSFHDREVDEIKARLGDFILFNTNTGIVHSAWGSLEDHEQLLVSIGWLDENEPWTFEMHGRMVEYDYLNHELTKRTIRGLASADPSLKIVLRPHPAENTTAWLEEFTDLPNVEIIRDGNHIAMILASRLVLHTGCTTGVEAMMLGHPTMSILPDDKKQDQWKWFVSSHVNPTAIGASEAIEKTRGFLSGTLDLDADRAKERSAARKLHFSGWDGGFVFDTIAKKMVDQIQAGTGLDRNYRWAPENPDKVYREIDRNAYFKRKMTISREAISERYRHLVSHAGGGRPTSITQIGDSVFLFENNEDRALPAQDHA